MEDREQHFRAVAETAVDPIITADRHGTIVFWNRAAEKVFGYTASEALGQSVEIIVPQRIRAEHQRAFRAATERRKLRAPEHLHEFTAMRKAGDEFPLEISFAEWEAESGPRITCICRDISDRKRTETEMRRLHQAIRTLSEANQALVRAVDEQTLLDRVCKLALEQGGYRLCWVGFVENDEAKTVRPVAQAGYEDGYLETVRITWADTERGRGPTGRAIRTGKPVIIRDIATDPDFAPWRAEATRRGYVASIALPIIGQGKTIGALMLYSSERGSFGEEEVNFLVEMADDLGFGIMMMRLRAEREQMQASLIQSDRLASMGTLAAGIAHEINNPLAYVIANLEFALRGLESIPPDSLGPRLGALHDALHEAREGAERVRHVVTDLRTFTRVDEASLKPVVLESVLESSINIAFNEIKHRATLIRDYRSVPPVAGNEARLGQVFLNLLINAAHSIPEGAADRNTIRVCTYTDLDGRAVVEIADTGAGIPKEHLARIFEPFYTTKPIGVGTGLGLTICRNIVSALGGAIVAESEVGKGSIFRVTLPAARGRAEVPASSPAAPPHALRRGRLLVVDDEPLIGRGIQRLLEGEHDVVAVTNAREALARIAAGERFDLVLSDLMMPEMSGMEFHAALSKIAPEMLARVVFVTGGAFTPGANEFLDRTKSRRVEKPFDVETLYKLIRSFLT